VKLLLIVPTLLLGGCATLRAPVPAVELERLVESYFDEYLALNPTLATELGDSRYDDRLELTASPEYAAAALALERRYRDAVAAIESEMLDPSSRLSREMFLYNRDIAIDLHHFPGRLLPLDQFNGGMPSMLAFLIGDYASEIFPLGIHSSSHYAALVILALTAVNISGIQQGKWLQRALIVALVLGLLFVIVSGFALIPASSSAADVAPPGGAGAWGGAMIFVLLTYGGWNEAAYLSAEIRENRGSMLRILVYSIFLITAIYLLVNFVLLKSLGLQAMGGSEAVAADLMRLAFGENGAVVISLLVAVAAISTMNATIITGARTNYALGRDFRMFHYLGHWQEHNGTPTHALLVQGAISLALVALGTGTRSGFAMMVEYTAPVFWFFFLLVGVSLFVLRRKEPRTNRPFRVPLYPLTPLLFCAVCLYMLYSSLAYTGQGALFGVAVLMTGIPLLLMTRKSHPHFVKKENKP
jgi:amino acid transporter